MTTDEACKLAAPSDGRTFDAGAWGQLDEDRRTETRTRLFQIRDSLRVSL
jgi:hypothetical protein